MPDLIPDTVLREIIRHPIRTLIETVFFGTAMAIIVLGVSIFAW